MTRTLASVLLLVALLALTPGAASAARDDGSVRMALALTTSNELVTFNPRRPERARDRMPITNLKPNESVVGIDFRPLTGRLYAIGSTSQVYAVDLRSGFATPIGAPFTPALQGTAFGVDFNPAAERIRIVSDAGQNLRINPDTGVATTDMSLAYAAMDRNAGQTPNVVGAAYTNNVPRAASTVLYDIDSGLDVLATQNPPNNGTLNTVGQLGVDADDVLGFDIAPMRDIAFAAIGTNGGAAGLFTIELASGKASRAGRFADDLVVRDIAVVVPEPAIEDVYVVTPANELLGLRATNPDRIRSRVLVTGLQDGERLVGIDVRPATGRLYGVGSTSRVYVIDPQVGTAVMIGSQLSPMLDGTEFGVDFNPQVDRLRIVSNTGQNLRVNPDTGAVASVDMSLAYAAGDANAGRAPGVAGAAYLNNRPGATATTLYDIDAAADVLVTQNPPNNGTLNTVGQLGVQSGAVVGFDIASGERRTDPVLRRLPGNGDGNEALAALQRNGGSRLYSVDLESGRARDRGMIGGGQVVSDLAIMIAR